MLCSDVCKNDLINMCGMLRACQLGIISREQLNFAIDNGGQGLDIPATMEKVRERLPQFKKEA